MASLVSARLRDVVLPVAGVAVATVILGLIAITESATAIAYLAAALALATAVAIAFLRVRPPFLAVLLLAFPLIAGRSVDVTPLVDVAYAIAFFGLIAFSIVRHCFTPRKSPPDLADIAVGVLMLGVLAGLLISALMGADLPTAVTEATAFAFILVYIPTRALVSGGERGIRAVLSAGAALTLVLAAINFREYVLDMRQATQLWHIAVNRVTTNEHLFMMVGPAFLALFAMSNTTVHRIVGLTMFAVSGAAVVIGQSRAVWISFLLGVFVSMLLMQPRERRRASQLVLALTLAAILALVVFFWDAVQVIAIGLIHRFGTLATATEADISLINRFKENSAVIDAVRYSPIVGHGFAVPYSYYSLVYEATHRTSFVHNTALGITYHVGLIGLLAVAAFAARVLALSLQLARRTSSVLYRGIGIAVAGALAAEVLSGMTEYSFGTAEKPLTIGIMAGLVVGCSQLRSGLRDA